MTALDTRRKAAGIKSEDLAKRVGTSPSALSYYRRGERQPSVDKWNKITSALEELIAERAEALRGMTT